MNFFKKYIYIIGFAAYTLLAPIFKIYAVIESGAPCAAGKICNPLSSGAGDIPSFIQTLLVGILRIGMPIIALAIIYCGFLFVAARGNPEKLTKAKDALLYTLIGAAILLGSWAIAQLISSTVLAL